MRKSYPVTTKECHHQIMTLSEHFMQRVEQEGIENFIKVSCGETIKFIMPILLETENYSALGYLKKRYPELFFNFNLNA